MLQGIFLTSGIKTVNKKYRKSTGQKGKWFHSYSSFCQYSSNVAFENFFMWSYLHSLKLYYFIRLM